MSSSEKKAVFIGRSFVRVVNVSDKEQSSRAEKTVSYTKETFTDVLREILSEEGVFRYILSEELVYVTTLFFPLDIKLTRELVRIAAEESVPEDLQKTEWDFRAMQYVKHQEKEGKNVVQVAVIAHDFSKKLEGVFRAGVRVESILPESYVLAFLEGHDEDLKVIVRKDQEKMLFLAIKQEVVLHTVVRETTSDPEVDFEKFISFVERASSEKVQRGIISGWKNQGMQSKIEERGLIYSEKEYDLFSGIFLESISGRDQQVLNLSVSGGQKKFFWWQRFFSRNAR